MYRLFVKRFIDLVLSILALPFLCVLMLIIAPLILICDGAPVFYKASRLGKNAKPYNMFKFRSMQVNAPDIRNEDGSTFNSAEDPRVTRIGRILRKTSLDELPQIINVLMGDMSFIGPRPTVSYDGFDFRKLDEVQKKHYSVRPGITGYSQAYFRNSITQEEKFINDAYYADNVSFALDVRIILKTIITVVGRKNIYNN